LFLTPHAGKSGMGYDDKRRYSGKAILAFSAGISFLFCQCYSEAFDLAGRLAEKVSECRD